MQELEAACTEAAEASRRHGAELGAVAQCHAAELDTMHGGVAGSVDQLRTQLDALEAAAAEGDTAVAECDAAVAQVGQKPWCGCCTGGTGDVTQLLPAGQLRARASA